MSVTMQCSGRCPTFKMEEKAVPLLYIKLVDRSFLGGFGDWVLVLNDE